MQGVIKYQARKHLHKLHYSRLKRMMSVWTGLDKSSRSACAIIAGMPRAFAYPCMRISSHGKEDSLVLLLLRVKRELMKRDCGRLKSRAAMTAWRGLKLRPHHVLKVFHKEIWLAVHVPEYWGHTNHLCHLNFNFTWAGMANHSLSATLKLHLKGKFSSGTEF